MDAYLPARKLLFLSLSGLLLFVSQAFPLVIEPLGVKLAAKPGEMVEGQLSLSNEKAVPLDLEVIKTDLYPLRDRYPDWLQLGHDTLSLSPGQSASLPYTVTLPEEATGQLMARISFQERTGKRSAMIGIQTRITIYLIAVAQGTERYEGEIPHIGLLPGDPPRLEVTVANTGNVYVKTRGECHLTHKATRETVACFALNERRAAFLPGQPQTFRFPLEKSLDPADYLVSVSLPFPDDARPLTQTGEVTIPPATTAN